MLRAFLLVGLGGGIGCMARYGVSLIVNKLTDSPFPLGTLLINLVGCFLIGLLFGLCSKAQWALGDGWLVLATGFCGGFTTFSTFALENVQLFDKNTPIIAFIYSAISVVGGILLCRLGILLTR